MNQGFILLHRKFMLWEWYQDKNTKILFIHCLLKANFETKEWQGIEIKRGQFFTSINHLSIDLKMSIKEIRTALKKLQTTNEIVQKGASKGTMITVCKYDSYQEKQKPKGKRRANEGQARGKRRATTNNDNNEKQLNNDNNKELIFPFNSESFINIWNIWKQYKKDEHKFTYKSIITEQAALKKLAEISDNNETQAYKIIENSIAQGYKGLFKLNNNGTKKDSFSELANQIRANNPEL